MNRRKLLSLIAAVPFFPMAAVAEPAVIDIHPYDMREMLNDTSSNEIEDLVIRRDGLVEFGGVLYNQTTLTEIKTEGGKELVKQFPLTRRPK